MVKNKASRGDEASWQAVGRNRQKIKEAEKIWPETKRNGPVYMPLG